jgi:peroxiredoxin
MLLLRDRRAEFDEAGVRVFGISRDSPWSHVAWRQALDLEGTPLLSDWNAEAVDGFDVRQVYRGLADVAVRSAFLVDANGIIRGAWQYGSSEVPDFDELLSAARSLS